MKRFIVCGIAVLLALSVQASPIAKGADEVRTEVVYDLSQSGDPYVAILGGIGHFVRDNLLLGGYASFEKKSWKSYWGVSDLWELGVYGEYDYLHYEKTIPFLGLSMGLVDGDLPENDTLFVARATAGVKYFVTKIVALSLNLNLDMSSKGVFDFKRVSDTEGDGDSIGFSLGLGARSVF